MVCIKFRIRIGLYLVCDINLSLSLSNLHWIDTNQTKGDLDNKKKITDGKLFVRDHTRTCNSAEISEILMTVLVTMSV